MSTVVFVPGYFNNWFTDDIYLLVIVKGYIVSVSTTITTVVIDKVCTRLYYCVFNHIWYKSETSFCNTYIIRTKSLPNNFTTVSVLLLT